MEEGRVAGRWEGCRQKDKEKEKRERGREEKREIWRHWKNRS